jgi:hypothetical protein
MVCKRFAQKMDLFGPSVLRVTFYIGRFDSARLSAKGRKL